MASQLCGNARQSRARALKADCNIFTSFEVGYYDGNGKLLSFKEILFGDLVSGPLGSGRHKKRYMVSINKDLNLPWNSLLPVDNK